MTTLTAERPTPERPTVAAPASTAPSSTIRSTTKSVKALPTTLRSEWIKLTTIRSTAAILAITAGVGGFVTWAVARYVTDEILTVADVFTFATVFTAVFAAVGGVLVFSSESQHGTLAPSLAAQPARWVIALAKTVLASGFGAVLGVTGLVAGIAGAWLGGIDMGDTSTMLEASLWAVSFAGLASVLGLGIGMIARHSTAAISGLLVWWLVVENLLTVFVAERFARFLPFVAGNGMLFLPDDDDFGTAELALSQAENLAVFAAYALVAVVVGTVLLYRRDTN